MNISRKWLREFVDIQATDKEYDETMTIAGQKVETTTRMDAEIRNVVVGKVLSMKRHEFRPLCAYSRKPVRAAVQTLSVYISQHA